MSVSATVIGILTSKVNTYTTAAAVVLILGYRDVLGRFRPHTPRDTFRSTPVPSGHASAVPAPLQPGEGRVRVRAEGDGLGGTHQYGQCAGGGQGAGQHAAHR